VNLLAEDLEIGRCAQRLGEEGPTLVRAIAVVRGEEPAQRRCRRAVGRRETLDGIARWVAFSAASTSGVASILSKPALPCSRVVRATSASGVFSAALAARTAFAASLCSGCSGCCG
jgi:anti-sigma factor RsiW